MIGLEAISILLLAVSIGCGLQAVRLLAKSGSQRPPQKFQKYALPQAQERLVAVTVYIPQSLFSSIKTEQEAQNEPQPKQQKRKRLVWRVGEHERHY